MGGNENKKSDDNQEHYIGPLEKRSCTDVICLLLFVAFICVWGLVGGYALKNGNLKNWKTPIDSLGRRCGIDKGVENKKFLVNYDFTKCITHKISLFGCATKKVCVENCPNSTFYFNEKLDKVNPLCTEDSFDQIKSDLICLVDKSNITGCDSIKQLIEQKVCSPLHIKSITWYHRCMPSPDALKDILNKFDRNHMIQNSTAFTKLSEVTQDIYADVEATWDFILYGTLLSVLASIIFISILRWLATPILWTSIFGTVGTIGFCTYFTWREYFVLRSSNEENKFTVPQTVAELLSSKPFKSTEFWLGLAAGCSILLTIILLVLLVLRKRISLAIALVKEGSKAVSSSLSTVFFPIIPWIFHFIVLIGSVLLWLSLGTIGDENLQITGMDGSCVCSNSSYVQGKNCTIADFQKDCHEKGMEDYLNDPKVDTSCQTAKCESVGLIPPKTVLLYKAVAFIGLYWGICFVSAFGKMVLASTFATWYWTMKKSKVPSLTLLTSLWRTVRYHLGTIAFGSLLLAICKIIRVIIEYIETKAKKHDNIATRIIITLFKCFFWCLEKFLKFFNTNAYIVCAIKGTGFCASAVSAFGLVSRNALRAVALTGVTNFLFFLSKVLVSIGMGASAYMYTISNYKDLNYDFVPATFVTVSTYLISSVFFSVYAMAVDTIFMCYLIDSETNDGSVDKPYYMSKSLMKIFGEKNKDGSK